MKLRDSILLLISFFCVVNIWLLRNLIVFGHYELTNISTSELWFHRIYPQAIAYEDGWSYEKGNELIEERMKTANFETYWNTFEYNDAYKKEYTPVITKHIPELGYKFVSTLHKGVFASGLWIYETKNMTRIWFNRVIRLCWTVGFLAIPFAFFRKNKWRENLFLFICSAFFLIVANVIQPMSARYRMMSYPFLFILMAHGFDVIYSKIFYRKI